MTMNVRDAIKTRKSIRAFTDKPVLQSTLEEILTIAQRAPSGTNTQPWHTYICTGDVREAITRDTLEMIREGTAKDFWEYDYYPKKWTLEHNRRRRALGWDLYGLLGIEKGDRAGAMRQMERNFRFFDAPVGIFVTVESYLAKGSWLDTGMYIQSILLAAEGMGLNTCPQAAWIQYQDVIAKHLGIPDDEDLVIGISLGYADPDAIENTLVSQREDLANVVQFHGFSD